MLIDRTSMELFVNEGRIIFVNPLQTPKKDIGLEIKGDAEKIKIHDLQVYELKSIW